MPLAPNEETAARRGRPVSGHACGAGTSRTAPEDQSTREVGVSACSEPGTVPCCIAMTVAITPATPEAAWVWPRWDFTAPSSRGCSRSRP